MPHIPLRSAWKILMMTMTMSEMIEVECRISFWFIRPLKLMTRLQQQLLLLGRNLQLIPMFTE